MKLQFFVFIIFFTTQFSLSAQESNYSSRKNPSIYAVIVGISDYQFSQLNLRYCDDDARSVAEVLYKHTPASNVTLLLNDQATKEAILSAIQEQFSKAEPSDKLIFYFSGHGQKGFFVPYNAQPPANNLLFHNEVKKLFKQSRAGEKYLLADACMSGSIRATNTPSNADTLQSGNSNAEVIVFMSSRDSQSSREIATLKHGVFSYFLVKGLRGSADSNRDRCISTNELYNYTSEKVKKLIGKSQVPVMWGRFDGNLSVLCW